MARGLAGLARSLPKPRAGSQRDGVHVAPKKSNPGKRGFPGRYVYIYIYIYIYYIIFTMVSHGV